MDIVIPFLWIILGSYLLYKGANFLVENAVQLAQNLQISLIVIGFIVIALGTSLPELMVGIVSGLQDKSDIVLGNILGSNMANFGLVLGIATIVQPIVFAHRDYRTESALLILASTLLVILGSDGFLSRIDGLLFLILGIGLIVGTLYYRKETTPIQQTIEKITTVPHKREIINNIAIILFGSVLLFLGAEFVVNNTIILAQLLAINEILIAFTVVALGTSLPELVTAVISSRRQNSELTIGNVLGSNVFNILIVFGLTLMIAPMNIGSNISARELPFFLLVNIIFAICFITFKSFSRIFGLLLILGYLLYVFIFVGTL